MFGRRQREDQAEAAREAERRALFEELAKRPDTVCPFLGLAGARADYHSGVTREHRCYAFGEPAELSAEQQEKVCLQRGYGNCPRYLRGVLVIPTEELEALRRPMAAVQPPVPKAPPKPAAKPAPAGRGGGRRGLIAAGVALLLIAGGATALIIALRKPPVVVLPSPTPSAIATASQVPSPSGSVSPTVTPEPTPIVISEGPLPTVGPGDRFIGYAVFVAAGEYPVVRLDADNQVVENATAVFDDISAAPVDNPIDGSDGTLYWCTLVGDYTGLCYGNGQSGDFEIYEVYRGSDGEANFRRLPNNTPTPS